ncbi:aldo/keto reductase [Floccifex sp.]|uniref:aldo/keto reductase n=1 Tax=Floccifex sp. TaxID=2815810 RepID=UPI003F003AF6
MEYYQIPQTNLSVSKISLGCMRIANKTIDEVDALVTACLEYGINFFDHADIYGKGQSEQLFGEVLKRHPEYRNKMIIQTKCGIVSGYRYDFSKEHIIQSVNESLNRLHVDSIDILLLHRPDALCDPMEVGQAFKELYEAGKVRYFGVSNHTPYQIKLLQKYCPYPIIINQLQLSIVHSNIIDAGIHMNMKEPLAFDTDMGILDYCRYNDIMIQAWSPLQASWTEGSFIDHPNYEPLNQLLNQLACEYKVSKTAIAIAWILRHPAHIQPIVGTTSIAHLKECIDAIKVHLTSQQWYDLYKASGKTLP